MGTNIMANQVKTPIQKYFEKVLYENLTFEIPPLWFLAHLAFRPCELLPSLFVRCLYVKISHFNLLLRNHGQLQPNFGGMVLGCPLSKIVTGDRDFQPRWLPN